MTLMLLCQTPDLAVGSVSVSPQAVEVGETVMVSGSLAVVDYVGPVEVRLYLSSDSLWDPGDQPIFGQTLLVSPPSATFNFSFALPSAVPADYVILAVADPDALLGEPERANNAGAASPALRVEGADLRVEAISGPTNAFSGLPYRVTLTLQNQGPRPARGFRYAYYLSEDATIRIFDDQRWISSSSTLAAGAAMTVTDEIPMPTITATVTRFVGVIVDLFDAVPEANRNNNIGRIQDPVWLRFPIPDLTMQILEAPPAAAGAEDLPVTRRVRNVGVAPSGPFTYAYYLSDNPTITEGDLWIGTGNGDLAIDGDDYGIDVIPMPSSVAPGRYYLGALVDPENLLEEVDEENQVIGPQLEVYGATIQFSTDLLPTATLGVPYEVAIYASGGPGALSYGLSAGALPLGITLTSDGRLTGTPVQEGRFEVTVRASVGSSFADRPFSLAVQAPTTLLTIETETLPGGLVGRPYVGQLVASGGVPPLTFSAITPLPAGLWLEPDGRLFGTPVAPSDTPMTFRVDDQNLSSASREVGLYLLLASQTVRVAQRPLPTALLGLPYCMPERVDLRAERGVPPYVWTTIGEAPPGLTLAEDGALCGEPTVAGRHPFVARVRDQTGLFDTARFVLRVDDGTDLAISTQALPEAQVGETYAQNLTAIRGADPYQWELVPGSGALPPGLGLALDGTISGEPSGPGVYAFAVRVVDRADREDIQPLSIDVRPRREDLDMNGGCGCEQTRQSSQDATALGLLVLVGFLLRRRRLAAVALFACLLTSAPAFAQFVPGTPYQMTVVPNTYVPCSAPNVLTMDDDDGEFDVTIPFQFKYYDAFPTAMSVGTNGAIFFGAGRSVGLGNQEPGNSGEHDFIAPMWDDQRMYAANNGLVGWQIDGVAPNRTLTVCYENLSRFGTTGQTFSMQVRMFEGLSGRIEIDYGPVTGSATFNASMGMEDPMGARPIFFAASACTTACTIADLQALAQMRITVVQDPGVEIVAAGITAPEIAFLGAQTLIPVTLSNLNANAVGPFSVVVRAGDGPTMMNPMQIGSGVFTLNGFSTQTVDVTSVFPAALGERSVYLEMIADNGNIVAEVNEANNTVISATPVRLLQGKPDLAVTDVSYTASVSVAAGAALPVDTTVVNVGGEPAGTTEVAVMLSSNLVISPQDVELARFTVTLSAGQSIIESGAYTIPADTNSGVYYIGAIADPDNTLEELSEGNNGLAAPLPLVVQGGNLGVATPGLPAAYVDESYVAILAAVGGDGTYSWQITSGVLPMGIGLVPATGELFGRPRMAETQTFTVEVTSDGQTAQQSLTIDVSDPDEPLTIVTRSLAPAVVGQTYEFTLIATGGTQTSSQTWSAMGLPEGLTLEADGTLLGTPVEVGTATIAVTVNSGGEVAQRDLLLRVRENANLLIIPKVLSTARYLEPYEVALEATGGVAPITWNKMTGDLPEGLTLDLDGKITGTPQEVGLFRFVVVARDSATGALNATDMNAFELEVVDTGGFSISTASLPDAVIGQGYDVTVVAEGGLMPYEWTITEGKLPDGVAGSTNQMTGEFRIVGQPTTLGVSNLLVEVRDSQNRTAIRALSIRVIDRLISPDLEQDGGGCVCVRQTSAPSSLLIIGLLGLGWFWRRRS